MPGTRYQLLGSPRGCLSCRWAFHGEDERGFRRRTFRSAHEGYTERMKALAIAVVMAAIGIAIEARAQSPALADLTPRSLPDGCELVTSNTERDGNRVTSGLWGGLPVTSNPWVGGERRIVLNIYLRMFPAPAAPDGPPLDPAASSRFMSKLADGITEAYTAFYRSSERPEPTAVYALRFAENETMPRPLSPRTIRLGRVMALVHPTSTECASAIETHIANLREP